MRREITISWGYEMKKALKAIVCIPLIVSAILIAGLAALCIFLGQCVGNQCEYVMDCAIDFWGI